MNRPRYALLTLLLAVGVSPSLSLSAQTASATTVSAQLSVQTASATTAPAQLSVQTAPSRPISPSWANDLIIYEVATKGFTSPAGAQSGTFRSAIERLDYLRDLGINAIWLSGTNLADSSHFYNLWTQYANIDPSKLDPTLGTEADFKALIDEAHSRGIRVFMDVITHGVMNDSPLVEEHPHWFRASSWGMSDYDWPIKREDRDRWWVDTYTNYVLEYGVDGFRLDVKIHRPDLWDEIKANAAAADHPIVVFNETWDNSLGTCDFMQRLFTLTDQQKGLDSSAMLLRDASRYYRDFLDRGDMYRIATARVEYSDGTQDVGNLDTGEGALTIEVLNPAQLPIPEAEADRPRVRVRISGINPQKAVRRIAVMPYGWYNRYYYGKQAAPMVGIIGSSSLEFEVVPFVPDRLIHSIQLSSHDDGWEGFPQDQNPYVAEGSRALFGYSFMLLPSIPLFMGGEEFNARYVPAPTHTADLYGEGTPGSGRWLYANCLPWEQLEEQEAQQLLSDVRRMIAIRKGEAELFRPVMSDQMPRIRALRFRVKTASGQCVIAGDSLSRYCWGESLPVPYLLWGEDRAVVVVANPTEESVRGTIEIALAGTPLEDAQELTLTDLWTERKGRKISPTALSNYPLSIPADHTPRGGLAVLLLERIK